MNGLLLSSFLFLSLISFSCTKSEKTAPATELSTHEETSAPMETESTEATDDVKSGQAGIEKTSEADSAAASAEMEEDEEGDMEVPATEQGSDEL